MKIGRRAEGAKVVSTSPDKKNSQRTMLLFLTVVVTAVLMIWVYAMGRKAEDTVSVVMWAEPIYKNEVISESMLEEYQMLKGEFEKYAIEQSDGTKKRRIILWEEKDKLINSFAAYPLQKDTIALISSRKPCVVITSGGMVQAGHSVDWVASSIDCSRDMIMVVGYVPEGSILDKLLKGQKTVKWEGKTYLIRCKIKKYNTFSSHLSAKGIIKYMKQVNTGMIVYHHGSKEAKKNAVEITKKELNEIGKNPKVLASYKDMVIKL